MQRSTLIITNTKSGIIVKQLFFDVLDFGPNSHCMHPRELPCLGLRIAVDPLPWGLVSEEIADDRVDITGRQGDQAIQSLTCPTYQGMTDLLMLYGYIR